MLDELGLVSTLRWCADQQAQRAGFELRFAAECSGKRFPAAIEMACYRVAQEALTNVVRHAQATCVWVTFCEHEEECEVELTIRDDGEGFKCGEVRQRVVRGASFGVQGMQERVELLGGKFSIVSSPGEGTLVNARIPAASINSGQRTRRSSGDETNSRSPGG
jgi:signal transduction histidine kinase